jgi:hypothetical protein
LLFGIVGLVVPCPSDCYVNNCAADEEDNGLLFGIVVVVDKLPAPPVALMMEEEREFNREKMRETGYRVGVSI